MIPKIRRAQIDDAEDLARLSGELGYPAVEEELRRRLEELAGRPEHAVFVAESVSAGRGGGEVVGWIHVGVSYHLESDTFAELLGLVVAGSQRSSGVGATLVSEAEAWARERGVAELRVRSNVVRERAHQFYLRQGFLKVKTQAVFSKRLERE